MSQKDNEENDFNNDSEQEDYSGIEKDLENDLSQIEHKPGDVMSKIKNNIKKPQGIIIVVLIGVLVFFLLSKLFIGGSKKSRFDATPTQEKQDKPASNQQDVGKIDDPVKPIDQKSLSESLTSPPSVPELKEPEVPSIPDLQIEPVEEDQKTDSELKIEPPVLQPEAKDSELPIMPIEEEEKKIRKRDPNKPMVPLFSLSGTGPESTGGSKKSKINQGSDFIFVDSDYDTEDDSNFVEPKKIGNLENTIAQGRVLNAVLETAINSEIPGNVRALVSNDVYSEVSKNILIPRGTRLYGNYKTLTSRGQSRISIVFSRVIRPDGVTMDLSSYASDQFGRAGVEGEVDRKYSDLVSLTFLEAAIDIGAALALTSISNNAGANNLSLAGAGGVQTVIQNPATQVASSLTNSIQSRAKQTAEEMFTTSPVVTINQGTKINVMVNQDIKLPSYTPLTRSDTSIKYSSGQSSGSSGSSSARGGSSAGGFFKR